MKGIFIFALLFFGLIQAQSFIIKIVDSEDQKNISGVRIISNNQVYYTNEDGVALLPTDSKNLNISASGYTDLEKVALKEVIALKPQYRNIDEVKIVSIDLTKFLQNVLKNYDKAYYTEPSVYDVTYWQRAFENNQLKTLIVTDGKFWSRDGKYNAKENFKREHDKFVQFQYDYLRYKKIMPSENKIKVKKQDQSQDYIGNLFLNYELNRLIQFSKVRRGKVSAKVIFEDAEKQEIFYSIKTETNLIYKGTIQYHKKDKAITYLELNYTQSEHKPYKLKDENGIEYQYQLGDGTILYEFYKVDNHYVPSKVAQKGTGFKFIINDQTYDYDSVREIVFKNFKPCNVGGLEKPVNLFSAYWNTIPVTENKDLINLTKEEQEFINDKNDKNED